MPSVKPPRKSHHAAGKRLSRLIEHCTEVKGRHGVYHAKRGFVMEYKGTPIIELNTNQKRIVTQDLQTIDLRSRMVQSISVFKKVRVAI